MTRAELHELVDDIPEDRLDSVGAVLVEIVHEDDDPQLTAEELAGHHEGIADAKAGRVRPLADVLTELGL